MPLALVQQMDEAFDGISISKEVSLKARELGKVLKELAKLDGEVRQQPENFRRERLKDSEKICREAVDTLGAYFSTPMFAAVILRLLDLLLGTALQWKHVAAFLAVVIIPCLIRKQRPGVPTIMVVFLTLLPSTFSGTLTRLGNSFFWFDSFCSPFVLYAQENISDRREVRWILIGMGLYTIYRITELIVTSTSSVILILVVAFLGRVVAKFITAAIYNGEWWAYNFELPPPREVVIDSAEPPWIAHFVESETRYRVQRMVFLHNRIIRSSIPLLRQLALLVPYRSGAKPVSITPYQYSKLAANTIRLLWIRRGRAHELVDCTFEEVSINTPGRYDAVSYVWGDDPNMESILIDGSPFMITKSAFDIIRRRRSVLFEQILWIDQVCINQLDDDEKSSQILMMEAIFREAERVVAFLTPASDAHLVQSHIVELHYRYSGIGYSAQELVEVYDAESKRRHWNAFANLLGNAWFRRVWIVQEAVFASNLCLFYGDFCIDWKYLSRAIAVLNDQQWLGAIRHSGGLLLAGERQNSLTGFSNIKTMMKLRGDVEDRKKITLGFILRSCTSFDATVPQDKVYAVLGLAKEKSGDEFKLDYKKENSPRFVYTRAMLFLLNQSQDPLYCLSSAGIGFERLIDHLPSWVPDWSHSTQTQILDDKYEAGTMYDPVVGFNPDNDFIIHLSGEEFDKVKHLGAIQRRGPNWTISESTSYMYEWFSDAKALAIKYASNPYPMGSSSESVEEAFIRTMVGNHSSHDHKERPSTEQCMSDYEAMQRSFTTTEQLERLERIIHIANMDTSFSQMAKDLAKNLSLQKAQLLDDFKRTATDARRFLHFSDITTKHRVFCVSEQGRMAVVPPYCEEGDIVCIIKGARMPFVLRMVSGEVHKHTYRLIGPCYVHGVMDGERKIQKTQKFSII